MTTQTTSASLDRSLDAASSLAEEAIAGAARVDSVEDLVDRDLLELMMARVDKSGLRLTGEGGFLPALVRAVLERGLRAELTEHLGYEKGAALLEGQAACGMTPLA
jgi:hypothetical protein